MKSPPRDEDDVEHDAKARYLSIWLALWLVVADRNTYKSCRRRCQWRRHFFLRTRPLCPIHESLRKNVGFPDENNIPVLVENYCGRLSRYTHISLGRIFTLLTGYELLVLNHLKNSIVQNLSQNQVSISRFNEFQYPGNPRITD